MMPSMKDKIVRTGIILTFVSLYILTSLISTLHSIEFFHLSNPSKGMSITLAIAFEIGAAASLASLVILHKMNRFLVWFLFIVLTAIQAMSNAYFAYVHLENYQGWIELFNLIDLDVISQKRILSIISGAILPLVALGFIKSLVDYIKPDEYIDDHTPRYKEENKIDTIKKEEKEEKIEVANHELINEKILNDNLNEEVQEKVDSEKLVKKRKSIKKIKEPIKEKEELISNPDLIIDQKPIQIKENKDITEKEELISNPDLIIDQKPIQIKENKKEKIKKQKGIITEPYDKIIKTIEEKSKLKKGTEEEMNFELEEQLNKIKNADGEIDKELLKNIYGEDIPKILKHYFETINKKNKPL